jgi:hypothetical protein
LLSTSWQRLSARERRIVLGGAAVSAAALALVLVVLPFMDRWTDREAAIGARREQLARLESLFRGEEAIRRSLERQQRAQAPLRARLVTGATPAIAASGLQELVQEYTDRSQVTLDRIDVVAEPKPGEEGLSEIPVQLSGQGDIYGLADLLSYLQDGEKLLMIDEVRVSAGAGVGDGGRADLLTWSVRLHGPYLAE